MKRYNLVIGPFESDDGGWTNGISADDRKELLEDQGWSDVRVEWLVTGVQDDRHTRPTEDSRESHG